jgi:hypothetical protein
MFLAISTSTIFPLLGSQSNERGPEVLKVGRNMETLLKLVVAVALCAVSASAQQSNPVADSELAAITARGRFLTQKSSPEQFDVKTYDPPQKDTGFPCFAVKGIQIAIENSQLEKRPYNTYVLPLDSGILRLHSARADGGECLPLGRRHAFPDFCRWLANPRKSAASQVDFS